MSATEKNVYYGEWTIVRGLTLSVLEMFIDVEIHVIMVSFTSVVK